MTIKEFKGTEDEKGFYNGIRRFCTILGDLTGFNIEDIKTSRRKTRGFKIVVTLKKKTGGMTPQSAVKIGVRLVSQFPAIYTPTFYKRYGSVVVYKPKGLRNSFLVEGLDDYVR